MLITISVLLSILVIAVGTFGMVQEYYDDLEINSKDMVIIKNTGHTPFLDNPEAFCEKVKEFLL